MQNMFEIIKSTVFERWLLELKDRQARIRVQARIDRLLSGNFGDAKPVREGISELRVDHGPGYRVYFKRNGLWVIILLVGGDKRTQDADIKRALEIAKDWEK